MQISNLDKRKLQKYQFVLYLLFEGIIIVIHQGLIFDVHRNEILFVQS